MNKSVLTNLTAILIIFIGLFPIYNEIIFLLDFCFIRLNYELVSCIHVF
ncbi:MAG: hypothetical protein CM15mP58_12870 [Burkholderiaceae bacterium]|nr:MAG: hypothetical protein CM15mP58_12870 [Burkholderiaceae bacterium]